ncbi:MAG TPA: hypothetical protein VNT55_20655 [Baekduia sp.]|nr:hypothetical protein [Baekduia sp.]
MGQFAYRLVKDGRVRISHRDRHVVTLAGERAAAFRAALQEDGADEQLLMARVTGNFKRGNERVARERSRRD